MCSVTSVVKLNMKTFADRLNDRITQTDSFLCAGFDPRPETMPQWVFDQAKASSSTDAQYIVNSLVTFYSFVLDCVVDSICCIKPNLAFFEQWGIAGIQAYQEICSQSRLQDILIIADAKRGDIGSTATAYASAFFGDGSFKDVSTNNLRADAVTINPFLGFDTLEPFLQAARKANGGLFILVRTSNPGCVDIQGDPPGGPESSRASASDKIAQWINSNASQLTGNCGLSGLGAVVGATHPSEAVDLRAKMPTSFFLIPGLGTQGGSAKDATAGLTADKRAGIINVSRGLCSSFSSTDISKEQTERELKEKILGFLNSLHSATN